MAPAEDQQSVRPSVSVMVICVLLNDAATCTTPCGTTRFSRFFLNSFLRLAGAPDFAGAVTSGAVFCCSFATCDSVSFCLRRPPEGGRYHRRARARHYREAQKTSPSCP